MNLNRARAVPPTYAKWLDSQGRPDITAAIREGRTADLIGQYRKEAAAWGGWQGRLYRWVRQIEHKRE